jgi:hypothetical protein
MSVTLSRTASVARKAYATPVLPARRTDLAREEVPAPRRVPAQAASTLGYLGLEQALAHLPAAASAVPATLLTAVIHTMGGAATSVARGLYLNTTI